MKSNLSAFLAQNAEKIENVKFAASKRFKDEKGKALEWEICCISAAENNKIRKACMRQVPVAGGRKGQFASEFDTNIYQNKIAVACTVFPNLHSAELQDSYSVKSAEELISIMLSPGEFENYTAKILEINGFAEMDELVEEAKN